MGDTNAISLDNFLTTFDSTSLGFCTMGHAPTLPDQTLRTAWNTAKFRLHFRTMTDTETLRNRVLVTTGFMTAARHRVPRPLVLVYRVNLELDLVEHTFKPLHQRHKLPFPNLNIHCFILIVDNR
jgi:hypothetical protein